MNTIEMAIKELKERDKEIKALKEGRQAMAKELQDRRERIDNAIEYINNPSCFDGSYMTKHDLLMLLSGIIVRSDKE